MEVKGLGGFDRGDLFGVLVRVAMGGGGCGDGAGGAVGWGG